MIVTVKEMCAKDWGKTVGEVITGMWKEGKCTCVRRSRNKQPKPGELKKNKKMNSQYL